MGKSKNILVMGGLGFIGSHLCRSLVKDGYTIRVFDKLYASHSLILDIEDTIEIFEGDIAKPEDVLHALENIDIAIHLIHTTVPGSSMQNPTYDVQSNVTSSTKWLPLLEQTDLKRIIYISSGGTVYGTPQMNPIDENHPTNPTCSYGITKLAIEHYIRVYAEAANIEYRICRPSNAYGEGQRLTIGQGVIGVFLKRAIEGKPLEIWGDGSCQRDYLYIIDLVNGIKKMIDHRGPGKLFNISRKKGYSLNQIVEIIRDNLKLPVKIVYKRKRDFDVPINLLDNTLIKQETGWEPETGLIEGIHRLYYYLKQIQGTEL